MYINKMNRETDEARIAEFVRQHPYGVLVSSADNVPVATHLPFQLLVQDGKITLQTHLARANPQWRQLTPDNEVLVIFGGPHAYISPRWYDHINVPTLNYVAVHAYGKVRLVTEPDAVYELLKGQIEQFESRPDQYNITTLPPAFLKAEMRALVALEMDVVRWEANFKLSQNRDEPNYRNIIAELEKSQRPADQEIARAMQAVYDRGGYKH